MSTIFITSCKLFKSGSDLRNVGVNIRLAPWLRRLISRLIAIIPALICVLIFGEHSTTNLLVLSQVILSLQLSFAVIPLVMFTSNRRIMGDFVNPGWLQCLAWTVAIIIASLNIWLLWQSFSGFLLAL